MTWAIFSDDQRRAIEEIHRSDSDRIVAIVGGALLDNTLHRTLSERLRDDAGTADKVLKINGPLGNPEPKIDVLYLLGAFDKPARNAMYGVTRARNRFAHNMNTSFDAQDQKMVEAVGFLTLHVGRMHYPHHVLNLDSDMLLEPVVTKRDVFLVNLKICLLTLMRDRVSHHTHTNTPLTDDELRARAAKMLERAVPLWHGRETAT